MNIKQLIKQRDELDAQIKALQETDNPPFKKGDTYFYARPHRAEKLCWNGGPFDIGAYEAGLALRSYEEAEAYRVKRAATVRVNHAIERINKSQKWVADWTDRIQFKYHILYCNITERLITDHWSERQVASIFHPMSKETAKAVIESHEADILCAMGVVK